ncbi:hypothetical protein RJ639_004577 [Escallonia herrerae]|uniref:SAM domain-containing protein n=1 Tax=Escallonia herrerae TaxID=1293975 RepID=A0AA88W464_9ASTE|nr:hypothetical protein RJ639_004577 [Escallonia herrerae]
MPQPEPFVTSFLFEKLPESWSDYKSMMKHKRKDITLEDVIVQIQIEEKNRSCKKAAKIWEFTSKTNLTEGRHDKLHGNHNRQNNRFGLYLMAKLKQRQLLVKHTKNNALNGPEDLDDSWVMVKMQKVTILIPQAPVTNQASMCKPGASQPQGRPEKFINTTSPSPVKTHSAFEREKFSSTTLEKSIPTARKDPCSRPISTFMNLSQSEFPQVDKRAGRFRSLGVCSTSKVIKRPKSFLNREVLLNQSLRALNLEKKLHRAGGLSSWLASLGLDQFVKIFRGKRVGKFQLVNMTMNKLKDMGADAVGPRRKLMHALDCLCQPYCFVATACVVHNLRSGSPLNYENENLKIVVEYLSLIEHCQHLTIY